MIFCKKEFMKIYQIFLKGFISLGILLYISSCHEGLAPSPIEEKSFIGGKITYIGGSQKWYDKDSVFAVRVVAFKNFPPGDIISELMLGNAYFTMESLPLFVDTSSYSIEIPDTPVIFKYIVVALQYDSSLTAQKAIGVYTITGDKTQPSEFELLTGNKIKDLNIEVDFDDLPPQPF